MNTVIVGRRIDAIDAKAPAFPLKNISLVRGRLTQLLKKSPTQLFCSAACGTDLLALDSARTLGIPFNIFLPYERNRFRSESVVDRPGNWGDLFDDLVGEARKSGHYVELNLEHEARPYALLNEQLLKYSLKANGRNQTVGIAVWEGVPRGEDDWTAQFINAAKTCGVPVIEISTLI